MRNKTISDEIILIMQKKRSVGVRELALTLGKSYPATWAILRKLRERGLVQRRDCPDDERYAEYYLTSRKNELGG